MVMMVVHDKSNSDDTINRLTLYIGIPTIECVRKMRFSPIYHYHDILARMIVIRFCDNVR